MLSFRPWPRHGRTPPRRAQAGLSLVELMVGVAVGLFIVSGAAMLASTQLGENRRLLLETQVQQDLRAAADIVTRELRRAGYQNLSELLIWSPGTLAPSPNNLLGLAVGADVVNPNDVVSYGYVRPGAVSNSFGFQWSEESGVIRHRIGATAQDLTDRNTLIVTAFSVVLENLPSAQVACPKLCSDDTQDCWPTLTLTDATVTIRGRAANDAAVERELTSRVRLRNDGLVFNVAPTEVCPP